MGLLKDINIQAGVVKDESELAAKPRWTDSDRIRFVRGLPQKLGGWARYISTTFTGTCRGMLDWQDNADAPRIALGTHKKLIAVEETTFVNITPIRKTSALTDPFTMVNTDTTVTVDDSAHGASTGDYVEITNTTAVGGITVDGNYEMTVVTPDQYTIEHGSAATSSATGGGSVTADYEISIGRDDAEEGTGWGVGTYGAGTYGSARTNASIVLPARIWTLDTFGEYLVACPRGGSIYEWQLNTGTRAAILSNAPTSNIGIFVTDERHLVALGAGGDKMLVQWCNQDANTTWTPSDQNTAGSRKLTGGSEILFAVRARGTNLIFTDAGVWTMTFIGGQDVFGFKQIAGGASGIISPRAAVEIDGVVYWMGRNDFYYYDGVVRRVPNSKDIRRFVFDNITQLQRGKSWGMKITQFSEIAFFYSDATEITRYAKFNYDDRAWDVGAMARTAGVDMGIFANPLMTDDSDYIIAHESGNDDVSAAMNEYIESSPVDIQSGTLRSEILGIIPDFKTLTGNVKLSILTREYPHASETEENVTTITSATERVDTLASGRQASLKITSDETGTDWRIGVTRLDIQPAGEQ